MRIRTLLLATLAVLPAQALRAQTTAASDSALVARIARQETQFFAAWREAWRDSLDKVIPSRLFDANRDLGAHLFLMSTQCRPEQARLTYAYILSAGNGRPACWWFAGDSTVGPDWAARGGVAGAAAQSVFRVDSVVRAVLRGSLLLQREALTALLDSAVRALPTNAWIVGQRLRFLLDEHNAGGALDAANQCRVNRWWCSALGGYALYLGGNIKAADSAFQVATAATAGRARCDWTDLRSVLGDWKAFDAPLDTTMRSMYDQIPCLQRDSLNATVLWLADPFWSDSLNERRVEHYARRVSLYLHAAVPQDELYNWSASYGGDALAEMIMRFGWPSRVEWAGKGNDEATEAYLRSTGRNALPGTPYLTAEYSRDGLSWTGGKRYTGREITLLLKRRHLIPAWSVVMNPLRARASDLETAIAEKLPWAEHIVLTRPIAQVAADQTALLRRESNVLFAYATNLGATEITLHTGQTVTAVVVRSTGPDNSQRIAVQQVDAAARLLVLDTIPSGGAIMSVEFPNEGMSVAARTRFAIAPPPTLAAMATGERAISEPVILQAPPADGALSSEPDSALSRMSGTTRLPAGLKTIGVYWETYGFAPGDSVDIAIRVQRYTAQSALERVGIALNMRGDKNSPVSVAWTEPQPGHASHVTAGPVPIVSRSIVLNIASLPKGDYWLDIGVRKNGQEPVIGRRSFVVQ